MPRSSIWSLFLRRPRQHLVCPCPPPVHITCPALPILLDFVNVMVFDEKYQVMKVLVF